MEIQSAGPNDALSILNTFRECTEDMHSKGINQWFDYYPNIEIVNSDINNKTAYIIKKDNKCIAAITLNEEQEPEYRQINWHKSNGRTLVVHRLAVHPAYQNQGHAKRLMLFAEEFAVQNGYTSIRLDTLCANRYAISLYEKLGYQNLGEVFFPQRDLPFACMEKVL